MVAQGIMVIEICKKARNSREISCCQEYISVKTKVQCALIKNERN